MQVEIYNCSGDSEAYGEEVTLNKKQVGGNQVSPDAVGGNVEFALPFPFNMNGQGTNGDGTLATAVELPYDEYLTLGVNLNDLWSRQQPQATFAPSEEWDVMVNAGLVEIYDVSEEDSYRYHLANYMVEEA